ncbi:Alpha/Beta hydrolase protein [Cadophora sp. MPI-SDFR-AT-0126]|nr:Alpha/Beta hydrolase protein [Leotiomycetes sp. MPI-SDFR-AT-0126]
MLRVVHGKAFVRQLYICSANVRGQLRYSPRYAFSTKLSGGTETQIRRQSRGPVLRYGTYQRRELGGIPTVLLPPVVFGGLVVALWTWKCCMMVLFQNKIIYMPGLPPNARRETIAEYNHQCSGIEWREESIRSLDGTKISLCVASVNDFDVSQGRMVYILYFQGNASSIPPRLPFLSPVLRMLRDRRVLDIPVRYTMVCCSYRGYWTSKGRPSEKGIALDAAASLDWIREDFLRHGGRPTDSIPVAIWGQSIGAGVATNLAAETHLFQESKPNLLLETLILETPFISVRAMLETLYPQKWLPYRHLWPFLWNHLDSSKALGVMSQRLKDANMESPNVILLEAEKDELIPKEHGKVLEKRCKDSGLNVEKKTIDGALHTEVMVRPEGRLVVVEAVEEVAQRRFTSSRGT